MGHELKKKRLTNFCRLPLDSAMGKRKQGEREEEVEGKRMRAESADDQDQKVLRRFEQLIEQLGPVR